MENDIEKIRIMINEMAKQYRMRDGDIQFAGVDGGVVKIAPSGFCWR